jgi:hypothetical protein
MGAAEAPGIPCALFAEGRRSSRLGRKDAAGTPPSVRIGGPIKAASFFILRRTKKIAD